MTSRDIYARLLSDSRFLIASITDNNYYAVLSKLDAAGFEFVTSKEQALKILYAMLDNGQHEELTEIITVPYVKDISGPEMDEAIELLNDAPIVGQGPALRVVDPVTITAIASSVGTLLGSLFNKGDKPTTSHTLAMQQQMIVNAEEDRKNKRLSWLIGGILGGVVLIVVIYFLLKRS